MAYKGSNIPNDLPSPPASINMTCKDSNNPNDILSPPSDDGLNKINGKMDVEMVLCSSITCGPRAPDDAQLLDLADHATLVQCVRGLQASQRKFDARLEALERQLKAANEEARKLPEHVAYLKLHMRIASGTR